MTPPDRHALTELDSRIAVMERRLRNAKAARDSYIDFLKSKYPMWSFPLTTYGRYKTDDVVMNRLATSEYNWDEEWDRRTKAIQPPTKFQLYEEIPNGGPLLKSDVARVRRRLTDIARQLRSLRETELNLSTEDYLRTRVQFPEPLYDHGDMLLAIRNRLSDMSFTSFEPVPSPTAEDISVMKLAEQRDAYIADIRAGRTTLGMAESAESIISNPSILQDPLRSEESKKCPNNEEKPTQHVENSKPKELTEVPRIASDNEKRAVTFKEEEAPKHELENVPKDIRPTTLPAPNRKSLAYQKMIGIFGDTNSSDTDDDAVKSPKPVTILENPLSKAVVREPMAEQSGAGTLSQYLSTANPKPDVPTSSDSDDDFFK